MIRRWHLVVLVLLGALGLACDGDAKPGATKTPTSKGYPASMAALGDSITAGFGSCETFLVCGRNSWSTGTADSVDSHYRRIRAKSAKIEDNAHNFAKPGAEADDLTAQATRAVEVKAQYVTILIGANDACAARPADMTAVATFRKEVAAGLARLKKGLPDSRVLVVSIPDLYRLWQLGHDNAQAVRAWNQLSICPSMLADPTSTVAAATARRTAVRDRIDDYNTELQKACRQYGKRCRWDAGRVHRVRYGLDLVNHVDYFHPNVAGQRELADVTWPGPITW